MNRAARYRAFIWQSILAALLIAIALAWGIFLARKPLQVSDLKIAAQSLHSYAAEGVVLAEQSLSGHLFRPYLEYEARFVRDKVHDVDAMLQRHGATEDLAQPIAEQRAAAHALSMELDALSSTPPEPARTTAIAGRLRQLSSEMASLGKRFQG
jgi:hypothetical protein